MLRAERFGKAIHYFAELESTNVEAWRLAALGAPEGEVVVADAQLRGKGRLGRRWYSPGGLNLYFSLILRPAISPPRAPQLTLMAAVALAETIGEILAAPPEIKWPNDLLFGGKKLAGILTESSCDGERLLFVILGVGVNVNVPPRSWPPELEDRATSLLAAGGATLDRAALLSRLLERLEGCYREYLERGFADLALRWERFFGLKGRRVRAESLEGSVCGTALGLDPDGALRLRDDAGGERRVIAGEIAPLGSG
jgi:BirA family biotin operon repressor/biotin-[acetyl-CoA-carboxylase] ligase